MMADRETFNAVNDVYERLGMDARNNPIDGDARNVKSKRALEKARLHVNHAIEGGQVKAAELARRTGIKASAISAFRNDLWRVSVLYENGRVGHRYKTQWMGFHPPQPLAQDQAASISGS